MSGTFSDSVLGFAGPTKTAAFTKKWTVKPSPSRSIHSCHRNPGRTLSLATFPTLTGSALPFCDARVCFTSRLINWKAAFRTESGTRCIPPLCRLRRTQITRVTRCLETGGTLNKLYIIVRRRAEGSARFVFVIYSRARE